MFFPDTVLAQWPEDSNIYVRVIWGGGGGGDFLSLNLKQKSSENLSVSQRSQKP